MQALLRTVLVPCFSRQFSQVDVDVACRLASELAKEAGKIMMRAQEQKPEYTTKAHERDLVTKSDRDVERLLVRGIREVFPDHEIIAEEGTKGTAKSRVLTDAPTWIIDPIDGTTNFVHGFPNFCTSIALYVEKKSVLGWIENPMLRQSYVSQLGKGVHFNGQPMRVSGQRELKNSLVYMECSIKTHEDVDNVSLKNIFRLGPTAHGIRTMGSTALNLAQVAVGACDAYLHCGSHVWDWAAGVPMVQEAGGIVIDPCGGPFDIYARRMLAAATPELAYQIVPLIKQLFPTPRDDETQ
ncbi:inositol monophosphatase 1 [Drosophila navojoa]|uniref:inositol monophosphatase 1 n=1 Tax=Drosophila navojoa TaxID=7232 RepID=UPI0011BDD66E|nr:inositol monophosphatase 1 [Drosophila navojoa]